MDEYLEEMKSDMEGPLRHLRGELSRTRTGRASLARLDSIKVDYYGAPTPLNGVATLAVPEPRMIIIKPWDVSMLPIIEKAIGASSLGINPNNDGKLIRLVFPELTGERRKELVKQAKARGEDAKIAIRNIRRETKELISDSGDPEDDVHRQLSNLQELTDEFVKKIDVIIVAKESEIMDD